MVSPTLTPVFDEMADYYHYDTFIGWAFEDGDCRTHPSWWLESYARPCCCPRPWSDAWMSLCDALRATDPAWDPGTRAMEIVKDCLRRAFAPEADL